MEVLMTGTQGCVGSRLKEVFTEPGYDVPECARDIRDNPALDTSKTNL